jgi:hypothetical protein
MVSFAHTLYGMGSNQIIQTMISTHTRAFDKRNTYEDRINNEHVNNFNIVINEAEKFIVNNSKKHKKELLTCFYYIKNANYQIVNEVKLIYGQLKDGNATNAIYQQEEPIFSTIDTDMQNIQNQLKLMTSTDENETQAIRLVSIFAKLISVTARKAKNNLEILPRLPI